VRPGRFALVHLVVVGAALVVCLATDHTTSALLVAVFGGLVAHVAGQTLLHAHAEAMERRYRQLVEDMPLSFYVSALDQRSNALYVSPGIVDLLGYSLDEWRRKPTLFDEILHPLDRDEVLDAIDLAKRAGDPYEKEYRLFREDGSIVWVRENTRLIRDEAGNPQFFEGSLEDITGQVEAEQALAQSQALYRVLLDNSRDGVFLIQRGQVKFANEAMSKMLGYPIEELVGMEYMRLVDPDDQAAQLARKEQRESGSRSQQLYEMVLRRKDGTRILAEVRADAVDYQGDIASTGTLRDVTEERAHQRALEQAERRSTTSSSISRSGARPARARSCCATTIPTAPAWT